MKAKELLISKKKKIHFKLEQNIINSISLCLKKLKHDWDVN